MKTATQYTAKTISATWFAFAVCSLVSAQDSQLTSEAFSILRRRCSQCHGNANPQSGLNVLKYATLVDTSQRVRVQSLIMPGKPDESTLWKRIASNDAATRMPPDEPLPQSEVEVIRRWIKAGAPEFASDASRYREAVTVKDEFAAITVDLRKFPRENRSDIRYFSISHLYNNQQLTVQDLVLFRAALSKMLNSLSWKSQIVLPVPVNHEETLFRVNLAALGWDLNGAWDKMISHELTDGTHRNYPYGLQWDASHDLELRESARAVYQETQSKIPVLRADWFIATAGVGQLYYDLLQIPSTASELEKKLNVNIERNFSKNLLTRAGFVKSGVSSHNRLVDRHASAYGAYWRSWDFASDQGTKNILAHPLGPSFPNSPFERFAFKADGGEIIFNLPNGLQAYMLVDAQGQRILRGPIEVVGDHRAPLGNREVINAVSCISCHSQGMQPVQDALRSGNVLNDVDAKLKLQHLTAKQHELDSMLNQDRERFQRALQKCMGPFIGDQEVFDLPEPITVIAKVYSEKLDLFDLAAELGLESGADLIRGQLASKDFRQLGLRTLANGGVVAREFWESKPREDIGFSRFQEAAQLFSESVTLPLP